MFCLYYVVAVIIKKGSRGKSNGGVQELTINSYLGAFFPRFICTLFLTSSTASRGATGRAKDQLSLFVAGAILGAFNCHFSSLVHYLVLQFNCNI